MIPIQRRTLAREWSWFACSVIGVFGLAMWGLSNNRTQAFEQFWLVVASVLTLADLGSSFAVVGQMWIVPIDEATLISLTVAAGLPMLPVVLFATPANELIGAVLKMLA
jgi:hypothetical protein